MSAVLTPGRAAALPDRSPRCRARPIAETTAIDANRAWEIDRALMLERSERRAWWVAIAGLVLGLIGIAAVFVQGPLRRVVEIPIVVDRVTGEATIQQRLSVETIPPMEALDKHNLATFVRAREGYSWMFLQRDFDQVARMAVPAVFADYNRQFEGDGALQKKIGASRGLAHQHRRRAPGRRPGAAATSGEATVTYDKVVRLTDRNLPEVTTRHVASVVYQYQPKVLAKERDRLENPFGFVVTAYRSDPEINTRRAGSQAMKRPTVRWLALRALRALLGRAAAGAHRSRRPAPARSGLRPARRGHRAGQARRGDARGARRRRVDHRGRRRLGWRLHQGRRRLVRRRAAGWAQPLRQGQEHGQRRRTTWPWSPTGARTPSASWCWPTAIRKPPVYRLVVKAPAARTGRLGAPRAARRRAAARRCRPCHRLRRRRKWSPSACRPSRR